MINTKQSMFKAGIHLDVPEGFWDHVAMRNKKKDGLYDPSRDGNMGHNHARPYNFSKARILANSRSR